MSGIHLLGRLEALLSLTTKIATRIPTSDPIKRSWYIMTAFLRVQDRTTRLNRPLIPTIDAPRAMLATYLESCYGLINTPARDTGDPRGTQGRDPDLPGLMPVDALTPFQPLRTLHEINHLDLFLIYA